MTTERNAQGVDVLAVLDRAASNAAAERDMHDANDNKPEGDRWEELRADLRASEKAVAELIAADRLLDKTQAAYDRASAGRMRNDLWADVLAARQRRAAALAKFTEPRP